MSSFVLPHSNYSNEILDKLNHSWCSSISIFSIPSPFILCGCKIINHLPGFGGVICALILPCLKYWNFRLQVV